MFFFWFGSGSGYTPQSDKYRRLSVRLGETFPRDAVSGCAQIGIDIRIRGDRRVSDLPERLDGVLFLFDHEPIRRFLATMPSHPAVHGVWRWCRMLVPRPFFPLSFRVFRRHGLCACFSTSAETKDLSLGVFLWASRRTHFSQSFSLSSSPRSNFSFYPPSPTIEICSGHLSRSFLLYSVAPSLKTTCRFYFSDCGCGCV